MLKIVSARRYAEGEEKMGNMTRAVRDLFVENERLKKQLEEIYVVSKETIEKAIAREQQAVKTADEIKEVLKRAMDFMMAHGMGEVLN